MALVAVSVINVALTAIGESLDASSGGLQWVIAILIGAVIGGILFVLFKKYDYDKNGGKIAE